MHANSPKLPDYSQWPTKEQTAAILDCSTKTVEAFCAQGKLHVAKWRRPTGGPKISVYHPADVEAVRRERFPDAASTFVMPAPSTSAKSESAQNQIAPGADNILQMFHAFLGAIEKGPRLLGTSEKSKKLEVPIYHRVYLTVREAAAYAGRPERHLRRLIATGALPANREGHTRVRRTDLDQL